MLVVNDRLQLDQQLSATVINFLTGTDLVHTHTHTCTYVLPVMCGGPWDAHACLYV